MTHRSSGFCLALTIALGAAAHAEEPAAPSAAATAATTTANPGAAAAEDNKATEATDQAAQLKLVRAQGYKPSTRNGEVVYCKREARLGSRFEGQTCGTLEEIARIAQKSQDAVEQMQRQGFRPPKGQ